MREVRLHKLGPDSVAWSYTLVLQPGPGPLGLQVTIVQYALLCFGEMYINIEPQVVDNLVLLHSQSEGRSRIYDLQLVAKEPAAGEVNIWCIFPDFS